MKIKQFISFAFLFLSFKSIAQDLPPLGLKDRNMNDVTLDNITKGKPSIVILSKFYNKEDLLYNELKNLTDNVYYLYEKNESFEPKILNIYNAHAYLVTKMPEQLKYKRVYVLYKNKIVFSDKVSMTTEKFFRRYNSRVKGFVKKFEIILNKYSTDFFKETSSQSEAIKSNQITTDYEYNKIRTYKLPKILENSGNNIRRINNSSIADLKKEFANEIEQLKEYDEFINLAGKDDRDSLRIEKERFLNNPTLKTKIKSKIDSYSEELVELEKSYKENLDNIRAAKKVYKETIKERDRLERARERAKRRNHKRFMSCIHCYNTSYNDHEKVPEKQDFKQKLAGYKHKKRQSISKASNLLTKINRIKYKIDYLRHTFLSLSNNFVGRYLKDFSYSGLFYFYISYDNGKLYLVFRDNNKTIPLKRLDRYNYTCIINPKTQLSAQLTFGDEPGYLIWYDNKNKQNLIIYRNNSENYTLADQSFVSYESKFDFGTLHEGEIAKLVIKFKNTGNLPIYIDKLFPSTLLSDKYISLNWKKDTIMPKSSGQFEIIFNTKYRINKRVQYVYVKYNQIGGSIISKQIKVTANVIPDSKFSDKRKKILENEDKILEEQIKRYKNFKKKIEESNKLRLQERNQINFGDPDFFDYKLILNDIKQS